MTDWDSSRCVVQETGASNSNTQGLILRFCNIPENDCFNAWSKSEQKWTLPRRSHIVRPSKWCSFLKRASVMSAPRMNRSSCTRRTPPGQRSLWLMGCKVARASSARLSYKEKQIIAAYTWPLAGALNAENLKRKNTKTNEKRRWEMQKTISVPILLEHVVSTWLRLKATELANGPNLI